MAKKLEGRVALITGTSKGIGKAVALRYAQEGATLVCVSRNKSLLETLDDEIYEITGTKTCLVECDITDYDKITLLAEEVYKRFKRLDILVGNAAIFGPVTPVSHLSIKDIRKVYETNVIANCNLISSMEPLLKLSESANIIMVTSGAANSDTPFLGLYGGSKAALNRLCMAYAQEVKKSNIKINLINPGPVDTDMFRHAFPGLQGEDPDKITDMFVTLAQKDCHKSGKVFECKNTKRGITSKGNDTK